MKPLTNLIKGLEVLAPFLRRHDFKFDNFENGEGSGGQFTVATFKNERKRFIIDYRFSIGGVHYQFDDFQVGHAFYLDHLGFASKKQFPDFQSDDKLIAFQHILHDFELIIEDFFIGSCNMLVESSKLQNKFIAEYNQKNQQEYAYHFDRNKIEKARQKYKTRDLKSVLKIYETVEYDNILSEFDKKLIEYCKQHS